MNKVLFLGLISSLILCKDLVGQSFTAGVNIGMGSYSMSKIKEFQDYRMKYSGLPAMVTDNFPVNWTSGVEAGLCFPKFPSRITWFYQFSSTGGRVSSKDYSGELKLDLVANCNQLGVGIEQVIIGKSFFEFSAAGKVSYISSRIKILDYLRIYDQIQKDDIQLNASGFGVEPGVIAGFNILLFRIGLYGGYMFSFSEGLHLLGGRDVYLKLPTDENIDPEWNGWRAALKIDIRIPLKKKSAETKK